MNTTSCWLPGIPRAERATSFEAWCDRNRVAFPGRKVELEINGGTGDAVDLTKTAKKEVKNETDK